MEKSQNKPNRTVVITGGSSGVGLAAAEAFAKEGFHVVIAARGKKGLDTALDYLKPFSNKITAVACDVGEYEDVKRLAETAKAITGRIDVWLNNAGVMSNGKFEEIPMELHHGLIKTNLFGYMHGAYAALPIFKEQGDGILINNVSIGAFMPAPYSAVYSATKTGIQGMMECLQGEISHYPDIHICNVYPQIQRSTGNMHSAKYSDLNFKIPPIAADPKDTAAVFVKLADHPKKDTFPGPVSYAIKTIYSIFPKSFINSASALMRLQMNMKDAPSDAGNILTPSDGPHRIYGETMLPVPNSTTKKTVMGILGAGAGFLLLRRFLK